MRSGSKRLRFLSQMNEAVLKSLSLKTVAGGTHRYFRASIFSVLKVWVVFQYSKMLVLAGTIPPLK